ncbi:MAG: PilC/PilY family type IV pilus protein [bacterium]
MKKIALLLLGFLFLPLIGEAKEGECKNPIFLSAFEIDPNLLILLDNSDSMNVIMQPGTEAGYTYSEGQKEEYIYNPNITYSGIFTSEFHCKENGYYILGERTPNNYIVAYFVQNDYTNENPQFWEGLYDSNYLNWLLTKANVTLWKTLGGANFYKVTLQRVKHPNYPLKTPEIPSFLEDLTDENGVPLLKEPKKKNSNEYYWFDKYKDDWSNWYRYWYKKPASRMNIARYVINDLIRTDWKKLFNLDVKFRYGLMTFRRYSYDPVVQEELVSGTCNRKEIKEGSYDIERGGELLVKCGSISTKDPVDLSHIDNIETALRTEVISDKYTPLAESVYEAGMYFIGSKTMFCVGKLDGENIKRILIHGPTEYGSQNMGIQSWCQDNSILLVTDGFPTYDTEVPPLKGSYSVGDIVPNDSTDFDFDGDGAEPPKFQELAKAGTWNSNGVECNRLGSETATPAGCTKQFCSHYLDDVVKYLGGSKTDLVPGTSTSIAGPTGDEQQRINTYIVGFQYDSPFLQNAAEADKYINGVYNKNNYFDLKESEKRYFSATNPTNLKEYLSQIIEDIIRRTSSSVAVAVSISTSESRSEDYVVRARFDPKGWRGYLEAFKLPYSMGSKPVWDGGAMLGTETDDLDDDSSLRNLDDSGKDRNIYTLNTSVNSRIEFKKGDFWLNAMLEGTSTLTGSQTDALIYWIRGEYRTENGDMDPWGFLPKIFPNILDERPNGWRLFDIVYSTPIVLGAPNAWYGTNTCGRDDYIDFFKNYKTRERMAFVGSNLGMLHAFKLTSNCLNWSLKGTCTQYEEPNCGKQNAAKPWLCGGWEKWAYIPSNLLPYLREKAEPRHCHFSGVDLGLIKTDIFMNFNKDLPDSKEWGTVLVGGEREGGSYYFALNITDSNIMADFPNASTKTILWEYSNRDKLGDAMASPEIGIVRRDDGANWVAFLTTSTNSTSGKPYIIPLDIATGKMFDWNGNSIEDDEISVKDDNIGIEATIPLTSACCIDDRVTDKKFDGLADVVYFGDVKGRVWKMTVGSHTDNDGKPYIIFEAKDRDIGGDPQPISTPISVAFTADYKTILFFGTGKYSEKEDIASTQTQTFYALIDKGIKYGGPTINKNIQLDKLEFVTQYNKPPECIKDEAGNYTFSGIATRTTKVVRSYGTESLGWYIDLNFKGCPPPDRPNTSEYQVAERVTEPPLIYAEMVFFTSFIPNILPCSAGGVGYIHALNYRTGEAPEKEVLEKKGQIKVSETKSLWTTSVYLGEGVPSRPVIDPRANQLLVQMSEKGEIMTVNIIPYINPIHILNWGEEGFVQYNEK